MRSGDTSPPTLCARRERQLSRSLLVAGAYCGGGLLSIATGMVTQGPSGQTAVVWLPPGIALAALLVAGRRHWIGVWLGALFLDFLMACAEAPNGDARTIAAMTASISIASAAQALVSVTLVRRFVDPALTLDRPKSVLRFLFSSALASLITSCVGSAICAALGVRAMDTLLVDWSSWWISDTVSVFLVTPVLLAWVAKPARLWRPRRLQLTLPLGVTLMLTSAAFLQATRLESERYQRDLELRADRLAASLGEQIARVNESLYVVRDLVAGQRDLSERDFEGFVAHVRERNQEIAAIVWAPRVTQAQRAEHEAALRARGASDYEISEYDLSRRRLRRAATRDEYFPVELMIVAADAAFRRGVDAAGLPQRRRLLELSKQSRAQVLSEPLQLVGFSTDRLGVLLASPMFDPQSGELLGFVIGVVRAAPLMRAVLPPNHAEELEVELSDSGAAPNESLLFQRSDTPEFAKHSSQVVQRELNNNGRVWRLRVAPARAFAKAHRPWLTYTVSLVGFCVAALMCGFLLVTTGRSADIHRQVQRRTLQLSRANRKLRAEIAAQLRMKRALQETEARWQFAVEEAGDGAWDLNLAEQKLYWSPRLLEVLGYRARELDDSVSKWERSVHPEDAARIEDSMQRHLRGETPALSAELRLRRRDGSYIWFATHAKVVARDARGLPLRVIGTQTNIDERKLSEQELFAHRSHLEQLVSKRTAELEVQKGLAERANLTKSLFLANMSHELRTPMHAILAYARLGLDRNPSDKLAEFLNRIATSGERLLLLLNDLLDLSKLEAGKMCLELGSYDLKCVAREAAGELEPLLRGKQLSFEITHDPGCGDCVAYVDKRRIVQLFQNILANAVRFSAERGRLGVHFSRGDANARAALSISFRDEGVGIPEGELEQIFESFVQSSTTRTNAGGTGLGLAICRQIAELHHGTLSAHNNPDRGATFVLTIPTDLDERPGQAA